jgi:hypothetical protein
MNLQIKTFINIYNYEKVVHLCPLSSSLKKCQMSNAHRRRKKKNSYVLWRDVSLNTCVCWSYTQQSQKATFKKNYKQETLWNWSIEKPKWNLRKKKTYLKLEFKLEKTFSSPTPIQIKKGDSTNLKSKAKQRRGQKSTNSYLKKCWTTKPREILKSKGTHKLLEASISSSH